MAVQSYQDLIAWQKSVDLVEEICRITKRFPQEELYGLTSQMRRAAVSIPSNIAEGQGRGSRGEFCQFLGHAKGSLFELETQVVIASRLGYIPALENEALVESIHEIGRILSGLLASLDHPSH